MESRKFDSTRVLRAVSEGVQQARREHKQAGRPIVVERDGKIVLIPPEEIEVAPSARS